MAPWRGRPRRVGASVQRSRRLESVYFPPQRGGSEHATVSLPPERGPGRSPTQREQRCSFVQLSAPRPHAQALSTETARSSTFEPPLGESAKRSRLNWCASATAYQVARR